MQKEMNLESLISLNEHLESLEDEMVERLDEIVDFEIFRDFLTEVLGYGYKPQGGRPPFDPVLMLKILILQMMGNYSDKRTELLVRGYLPWLTFLGFKFGDTTPDENTIRHFRNRLTETGAMETLLRLFKYELWRHGYFAQKGQAIDGSLIKAPKQRFTREEWEAIEAGKSAREIWPDEPAKAAQKDLDARWVSRSKGKAGIGSDGKSKPQRVERKHGYNLGICVDIKNKLIWLQTLTPANVNDGLCLKDLVDYDNTGADVHGDGAYTSKEREEWLGKRRFRPRFPRRRKRGKPMSVARARANTNKARRRSRVEHAFGHMKNSYGLYIRTIGLARAKTKMSLAVLAYNMDRLIFLERRRCSVG